jgi:hypothetical protein
MGTTEALSICGRIDILIARVLPFRISTRSLWRQVIRFIPTIVQEGHLCTASVEQRFLACWTIRNKNTAPRGPV